MKACAIFNETFRTSRVVTMHFNWGGVSAAALEIAQRFNAGFRLEESPKSLQGRQTRHKTVTVLSSLKGLLIFSFRLGPALKRWAIVSGKTDAKHVLSLTPNFERHWLDKAFPV